MKLCIYAYPIKKKVEAYDSQNVGYFRLEATGYQQKRPGRPTCLLHSSHFNSFELIELPQKNMQKNTRLYRFNWYISVSACFLFIIFRL